MAASHLIWLVVIFFLTSAVGVVTGSNSLITVPVMMQFGIAPEKAVATNMFGLLFMAVGATIPFARREGVFDKKRLPKLIILTVAGSSLGALLVGLLTGGTLKIIISVSMIAVTIFTLVKRDAGVVKAENISAKTEILGSVLTFALGIYGGLFSGGYVTILTTCFIVFFGMTFTQAVANTKLVNIFSSLIASIIFAWQGLIDYKLGIILGVTMFAAAYIGAHTVTKLNDVWLKRIFIATVLILAVKMIFDFLS
ncbi:MAG: sulfite exporter TauE/SafE family protein [Pyrinomonadaceae bacterium]